MAGWFHSGISDKVGLNEIVKILKNMYPLGWRNRQPRGT